MTELLPILAIEIAKLRRDGGTQPRAALDQAIIAEYAEAMRSGDTFPPVVAFYDGSAYWLADGYHRVAAAESLGSLNSTIQANIYQGDRRAAVLYSTGVNAEHGLRRTNADKRRAVEVLLRDSEWSQWSDREIARQAKVSNTLVSELRRSICQRLTDTPTERQVQRAGTTYIMHTAQKPEPAMATQEQLQNLVRSWLGSVARGNHATTCNILNQISLGNSRDITYSQEATCFSRHSMHKADHAMVAKPNGRCPSATPTAPGLPANGCRKSKAR